MYIRQVMKYSGEEVLEDHFIEFVAPPIRLWSLLMNDPECRRLLGSGSGSGSVCFFLLLLLKVISCILCSGFR
jgi:hypothetical protein